MKYLKEDELERMIDSLLIKDKKEDLEGLDRHFRYEKVKEGTLKTMHFCEGIKNDEYVFKIGIDAQTEFASSSGDIIAYGVLEVDKNGVPINLYITKREQFKECINKECRHMMPDLAKFCSECGKAQFWKSSFPQT